MLQPGQTEIRNLWRSPTLQDLHSTHDSTIRDAVRQATWNGTRVTPVGDRTLDNSHRT